MKKIIIIMILILEVLFCSQIFGAIDSSVYGVTSCGEEVLEGQLNNCSKSFIDNLPEK